MTKIYETKFFYRDGNFNSSQCWIRDYASPEERHSGDVQEVQEMIDEYWPIDDYDFEDDDDLATFDALSRLTTLYEAATEGQYSEVACDEYIDAANTFIGDHADNWEITHYEHDVGVCVRLDLAYRAMVSQGMTPEQARQSLWDKVETLGND